MVKRRMLFLSSDSRSPGAGWWGCWNLQIVKIVEERIFIQKHYFFVLSVSQRVAKSHLSFNRLELKYMKLNKSKQFYHKITLFTILLIIDLKK